ncbi:hypothetical protein [Fodinicola feengrottensis]|uniref:hypothetical protein n=1 Tax=Fodinicola feengrottensis TaxID=435914 RepID=UPI0028BDFF0C|nr:hypothetical protein [Fodinicola feengrottensis]
MTGIATAALDQLRERLGDAVVTDVDVMAAYAHDEADLVEHGQPGCVVHARSTEDVRHVVRVAGQYGIPVVPAGSADRAGRRRQRGRRLHRAVAAPDGQDP